MRIIKKLLLGIVLSMMLCTSIGFSDNIYKVKAEEINLTLSYDPDIPEDVATRVTDIISKFALASDAKSIAVFGANLASGTVGILNLATELLKLTGIFGPSAEELYREQLNEKLNAIDSKITEVSDKVDSLTNMLNAALKKIDEKMTDISVKLDQENISTVAGVASSLRNELNNYQSTLNSHYRDWYFNNYQYTDQFLTVYGVLEKSKEVVDITEINVNLDLIKDSLNEYKPQHDWNVDKAEELIKGVFAIVGEKLGQAEDASFITWIKTKYPEYTTWTDFANKEQIIADFSKAGQEGLAIECAKKVAYAKTSDARTYASELLDKFTLYCNYLKETNNDFVSPLRSHYNIYSSLYTFQGDLNVSYDYEYKKDGKTLSEHVDTNLPEVVRQKYLAELNDFGGFVGTITRASQSYTQKDLTNLLYVPWAQAEKKLDDIYKGFYHLDNYGNPIDNYCYVTKSVLEFKKGDLRGTVLMNFYAWENGFGTDIKSYRNTCMETDFNYSLPNQLLLSSYNMNMVFAHYTTVGGDRTLTKYLQDNKVQIDENLPSTIVTNFIGGRDFTSDDNVKMFIKNCHNNPDEFSGKDYLKGDTTNVTSSRKYFRVKRKAVADVFDLSTGTSINAKRIGALASFYEKWTFKDDLVLFWDAEYKNPSTKDELIALANRESNFYNRERYDTSSDPEERYNSRVYYNRAFGSIISVPLSAYIQGDYVRDDFQYQGIADRSVLLNGTNTLYISNVPDAYVENKIEFDDIRTLSEETFKAELNKYGIIENEAYHYAVYFDESAVETVDKETYNKLFEFIKNNYDQMAKDYNDLNLKADEIIDAKDNEVFVSNDLENVEKLIKALIEDELDCIIVEEVPSTSLGKNVYNYQTGDYYILKDDKYVLYSSTAHKNSKEDYKDRNKRIIVDSNESLFDKGDYPCSNSKDIKLKYLITPYMLYELYFDSNGDVQYLIYPIYDVDPFLEWSDGEIHKLFLSNRVLNEADYGDIEVKLPVLQFNDIHDNRAEVEHYLDLDHVVYPNQTFNSKIVAYKGDKCTYIKSKEFSPFYISKTYLERIVVPDTKTIH